MASLHPTSVRLTPAMLERVDDLLPELAGMPELATPARVPRSDALRLCLLRGLEALEEETREDKALAAIAEERAQEPDWVTEDEAARRLGRLQTG